MIYEKSGSYPGFTRPRVVRCAADLASSVRTVLSVLPHLFIAYQRQTGRSPPTITLSSRLQGGEPLRVTTRKLYRRRGLTRVCDEQMQSDDARSAAGGHKAWRVFSSDDTGSLFRAKPTRRRVRPKVHGNCDATILFGGSRTRPKPLICLPARPMTTPSRNKLPNLQHKSRSAASVWRPRHRPSRQPTSNTGANARLAPLPYHRA